MPESAVRRVLMTGDTVGGVWTYCLELARALAPYGVEIVLAAMGSRPSEAQQAEAARIGNLRLLGSDYRLEWMDDPWPDVEKSGRWLLYLQDQYRPDVVHLNSYGHGTLPWRAPVVLTAHSCVLSWWAAVKTEPLPPRWNRYRWEVQYSLQAADLVTAPSRAMLRSLEANYGPALPPCRVIPNGHSGIPAPAHREAAKEPFILTAGRLWDEAKNVAAVAEVAPRLPWPVYVAGESVGPNGGTARLDGCRLLGRLPAEALDGWYARASIYALPARYEPFGLSALEAALCGCALVLGDIQSLREIWDDAAVFVPPGDSGRLEAALRDLIENPTWRAEMARRSQQRARHYTPERMAGAYLDEYRTVAAQRRVACAS